jgi:hypothetical protein
VIVSPPTYTKPPWATRDTYPFFAPFRDFVSTFVLETPENYWRDYTGYTYGV